MKSKLIFAFLSGVTIGVVGSCFYWYKRCEEEKAAVAEDYKNNYRGNLPTVDAGTEGMEVNPVRSDDDIVDGKSSPSTVTTTSIDGGAVEIEETNYKKISEAYRKPDISEIEEGFIDGTPEDVFAASEHPSEEEPCREISFDEFINAEGVDHGSLEWYTQDGGVTDAEGNEIEYPYDILGDALESIDVDDAIAKGAVYIRNELTGVDYDVSVIDASYSDIKEGVGGA